MFRDGDMSGLRRCNAVRAIIASIAAAIPERAASRENVMVLVPEGLGAR
jgi:hypothetical protein